MSTTENLNETVRTFKAEMKDGSRVTYKVSWQGYMDFDVREDGEPSTWTHPFDDRRCSWSITGRIVRSVAIVIAGQNYIDPRLTQVLYKPVNNVGSSFSLANLHPENCNDCADRRNSDLQDMRSSVNGSLEGTADDDIQNVYKELAGQPEVLHVNV